ncbi:integrase [Gossypium australe]|uniref:Integrase n=1 Tax=Gossypium australe TaxID=47621 RepID=A0A5B6VMN0_9ROSI|nr:integrase [Gossypium australe]
MKREITEYVAKCLVCQQAKEQITMDFVLGLSLASKNKDVIWVIVDKLTKLAHYIPMKTDYSLKKLDKFYISEITRIRDLLTDFRVSYKKRWAPS